MNTATRLLQWYNKEKRDLPWRKTKDPYKILVSEIMLQQTQVDRVKGFYTSWLKEFPSWSALAEASNADVIQAWSGLGYNRRALALRDIAKQVVDNGVPKTREQWIQLKGIGPYTSAAIALFSTHEEVFPVDSIIRRVLGRFALAIPFPDLKQDEKIEAYGLTLFQQSKTYYDIPQALFDLGTKICSKTPQCQICPLKNECKSAQAFLSGDVQIPKRSIAKAKERIHAGKKHPDRIYRGRVLKVVKSADHGFTRDDLIAMADLDYHANTDEEWFMNLLARLEKDQLIICEDNRYFLPK